MKRILGLLKNKLLGDAKKFGITITSSYSQCGEDKIIFSIFSALGISNPSYLDIGAHHPTFLSNTALFYLKGSRGINIEPDPFLFAKINAGRKNDVNLQVGIGSREGIADFYLMNDKTMNTFSKSEAERLCTKYNLKIEKIITVEIKTINQIIKEYCNGIFPDFLSLDIEGLDYEVLKSIDFSIHCPKLICAETIESGTGQKRNEILRFLKEQDYYLIAETSINSIFVRRNSYNIANKF